ncbi:hypothetical protein a10_07078 [Streptomyces acidiscabies]|nr:hypothetical protein [Streptomyces acidiscabies]GAQ57209.1 hypothetical protein a10_07078 [Streptomyces acidiscabies]
MSAHVRGGVGGRVAYYRSIMRPKMSQRDLADALGVDPFLLLFGRGAPHTAVHAALPALSAALATQEIPEDGVVRPLRELRADVDATVDWRLTAHYTRIARRLPGLLAELARARHQFDGSDRAALAALLVTACRSADAAAFKVGAWDLSARLIDLMRSIAPDADDPLLTASVAYVRTETFFAASAHTAGLRALEQALDAAPAPATAERAAARGALHMRAAVIAGRAGDIAATHMHLTEAHALADQVPEAVYHGTAFGPDSVRVHEVSVAVSLGHDHVGRALEVAREWKPPIDLPAERRSGFYIDLVRAYLWSGQADRSFEALKAARRIAPQHTREHPWVREDAGTLRRLKRADSEALTAFAEWCSAL